MAKKRISQRKKKSKAYVENCGRNSSVFLLIKLFFLKEKFGCKSDERKVYY